MTDEKKNRPLYKIRCGGISASIFSNTVRGKDGKDFKLETISIQKSYLDKDEKWQNSTISLRRNDLIKLQIVLQEVAKQQFVNKDDSEEKEA